MTLKLEVGKAYVSEDGTKYKVVYQSTKGEYNYLCVRDQEWNHGREVSCWLKSNGFSNIGGSLVKEWKEPVVHRRDVVWYKNCRIFPYQDYTQKNVIYCGVFDQTQIFGDHIEVLKRQTVEYVEE